MRPGRITTISPRAVVVRLVIGFTRDCSNDARSVRTFRYAATARSSAASPGVRVLDTDVARAVVACAAAPDGRVAAATVSTSDAWTISTDARMRCLPNVTRGTTAWDRGLIRCYPTLTGAVPGDGAIAR